jgi:serine/threonine protein kinase/tetratricopeptide (TPR) repeat protein
MRLDQIDLQQAELNDLLDAYERARAVEGDVDLRDCLPRPGHPFYLEARRELVRLDMEYSWQNHCQKRIAVYLAMFPDLLKDEESARDITFEEYRLRVLAGESPTATEYEQLYGVNTSDWPGGDSEVAAYPKTVVMGAGAPEVDDLNAETVISRAATPPLEWDMLEDVIANHPSLSAETARALLQQNTPHSGEEVSFLLAQALTSLPGVGTNFLNFHLIAELGRGSFGCVYLARQSGLANRLVALKLTVDLQGEEQKLAQLQHTNVVPIYSAHKTKRLHAVCMPYFGPTTLADVVRQSRAQNAMPESGAFLVETLRARQDEFVAQTGAPASATPALARFAETDYVTAVLWLAERITEGLIHAHEHGILHGDLKPANILLTEEGQPMLLDFNLSTDIKVHAGIGELRVGGTLPYMAPEHLSALKGGDKRSVDARSDVYALGVILFELLTGKLPFESKRGPLAETLPGMIAERSQTPPWLRPHNAAISPAVESIVRRCLEPDTSRRYQSAQDLHEDLQRHALDLPLKHAPEPSLRERGSKWVRRHPRLTAPTNVIMACLFTLAILLTPGAWRTWQEWQSDHINLAQVAHELKKERKSADDRTREVQAKLQHAEALKQYLEFHASAAQARDLIDRITLVRMRPDILPLERDAVLQSADACRKLLANYGVFDEADWRANPKVAMLPPAEQATLRADVATLLYVLAESELFRASELRGPKTPDDVLDDTGIAARIVECMTNTYIARATNCNELASRCFAADELPQAFLYQQANLAHYKGDLAESRHLTATAKGAFPREDVDDAYWSAANLAVQAKAKDAEHLLAVVARPMPEHFAAWRLKALCYQSAGLLRKAENCWDACVAIKPGDEWSRYLRGQACLQQRKWPEAQNDFSAFLKNHPDFREAYVQRAKAFAGQQNQKDAIKDLTKALELGPRSPELLFRRAQLMQLTKDDKGAEDDRIVLLSTEPEQSEGWYYRGLIQAEHNPKAALADLERALKADPDNVAALYQKALLLADRLERPVEAANTLDHLLKVDPTNADALLKHGLLYARVGLRKIALADAERALECEMTPSRYYDAACIYAFTSKETPTDRDRVIELLKSALREGYSHDRVKNDPNLPHAHIPEAAELLRAAALLGPMSNPSKN